MKSGLEEVFFVVNAIWFKTTSWLYIFKLLYKCTYKFAFYQID